jgi:thiol-disulfide isomerase/thioredoxin
MKYGIAFFLALCCYRSHAQQSAKQIIDAVHQSVLKKQTVQYKAHIRFKFFDHDDTSDYDGSVYLKRIAKDTFFGGLIRFSTVDTFYRLYDGKKIYWVNNAQKTVTSFNPLKGETWGMDGNISYRLVWKGFIEPKSIEELTAKENRLTLLADTVIKGKDCYRLKIELPDEDGFTENTLVLAITKADSLPVYKVNTVRFQGTYQYSQFAMDEYDFAAVPAMKFSSKQIPKGYKITAYKQQKEDSKTIAIGTIAPQVSGNNYSRELKPETIVYSDKITMLDFWYMGCYPCGKAIPVLGKLQDKYANSIRIVGINSLDSSDKSIKKLPNYIEYNAFKYNILMVSKSLPGKFKVKAWPTVCIIDKKGIVRHVSIGYSDKMENELSAVIDRLLKE